MNEGTKGQAMDEVLFSRLANCRAMAAERLPAVDRATIDDAIAELQVQACQVGSLRAALLKVLDTREKEAKAHFAFQTAIDNYTSGAAREGRLHMAAMTAASNAEKEARLLLATLKPPNGPHQRAT